MPNPPKSDPLYRLLLKEVQECPDRGAIVTFIRTLCRISMNLTVNNNISSVSYEVINNGACLPSRSALEPTVMDASFTSTGMKACRSSAKRLKSVAVQMAVWAFLSAHGLLGASIPILLATGVYRRSLLVVWFQLLMPALPTGCNVPHAFRVSCLGRRPIVSSTTLLSNLLVGKVGGSDTCSFPAQRVSWCSLTRSKGADVHVCNVQVLSIDGGCESSCNDGPVRLLVPSKPPRGLFCPPAKRLM